jgi:hypothetical protein
MSSFPSSEQTSKVGIGSDPSWGPVSNGLGERKRKGMAESSVRGGSGVGSCSWVLLVLTELGVTGRCEESEFSSVRSGVGWWNESTGLEPSRAL